MFQAADFLWSEVAWPTKLLVTRVQITSEDQLQKCTVWSSERKPAVWPAFLAGSKFHVSCLKDLGWPWYCRVHLAWIDWITLSWCNDVRFHCAVSRSRVTHLSSTVPSPVNLWTVARVVFWAVCTMIFHKRSSSNKTLYAGACSEFMDAGATECHLFLACLPTNNWSHKTARYDSLAFDTRKTICQASSSPQEATSRGACKLWQVWNSRNCRFFFEAKNIRLLGSFGYCSNDGHDRNCFQSLIVL